LGSAGLEAKLLVTGRIGSVDAGMVRKISHLCNIKSTKSETKLMED